ncbi:hypothetical protein ACHAQH_004819 [Verticillium albo-atrum]
MKTWPAACVLALAALVTGRRPEWEGEALDAPNSVFITWESGLQTGDQIIFVKDSEGTSILAYACDNKLSLGGVPIQVFADNTGYGEMTIGDARYNLEFTVEKSGGIVCEARWNLDVAVVECEVPWATGGLDTYERLPLNLTSECLGSTARHDLAVISTFYEDEGMVFPADPDAEGAEDLVENNHDNDAEALFARQGPVCQSRRSVKKKGDGNPHKWRRHEQLTDRVNCKNGGCSMQHGIEVSVTHQAGFSLSGIGSSDWINGGYSVSWTKGNSQVVACDGESHEVVCVYSWRRYQEYTVVRDIWSTCKPSAKQSKTYDIWSPLTGSNEHEFYCQRGGCKGKGHVMWEDRGKGKHGAA